MGRHLAKILALTATADELDEFFYDADLQEGKFGPWEVPDLQGTVHVGDVVVYQGYPRVGPIDLYYRYGTVMAIKSMSFAREDRPSSYWYRIREDVGPVASGHQCRISGDAIHNAATKSTELGGYERPQDSNGEY